MDELISKLDNATGAVNPSDYMGMQLFINLIDQDKLEGTKVRDKVDSAGPGGGSSGSGDSF